MAHLRACLPDLFRGRALCLLCDGFYRVVGVRVVARTSVGVLLLDLSVSRARPLAGCARVFRVRAPYLVTRVGRWMRRVFF